MSSFSGQSTQQDPTASSASGIVHDEDAYDNRFMAAVDDFQRKKVVSTRTNGANIVIEELLVRECITQKQADVWTAAISQWQDHPQSEPKKTCAEINAAVKKLVQSKEWY